MKPSLFLLSLVLIAIFAAGVYAQETESGSSGESTSTIGDATTTDSTTTATLDDTSTTTDSASTDGSTTDEVATTEEAASKDPEAQQDSVTATGDPEQPQFLPFMYDPKVPESPIEEKGSFQTNLYTGSATYTYPIQVPPGTNGLAPAIGLSYSSAGVKGRSGLVGLAWNLPENYIQRDVSDTPDDTSDDEFDLVLNGNKYDLVYNPSDGRYHTKIESYTKIEYKTQSGIPNEKDKYWLVTTKDGTKYRFGYNLDSENMNSIPSRNYVWRWSLDLVTDTHENNIYYSYREKEDNQNSPPPNDIGTVYPYKIEYNNDRKRVVEFVLETVDRPDTPLIYDQGSNLTRTRRLKEIVVKAEGAMVRKYVFSYELNPESTKSLLSSITEYGSDGTPLPAVTFTYNRKTPSWYRDTAYDLPTELYFSYFKMDPSVPSIATSADRGVRFVDINGDGLVDIIRNLNDAGTYYNQAWINTGSGWSRDTTWDPPTDAYFTYFKLDGSKPLSGDRGVNLVDVNGDGLVDIVQNLNDAGTYYNRVWLNTGSGWSRDTTWDPPTDAYFTYFNLDSGNPVSGDRQVRFGDVDGDGLVDMLQNFLNSNTAPWTYVTNTWINTGSGWVKDNTYNPVEEAHFGHFWMSGSMPISSDMGTRFVDVNGDGLVDILQNNYFRDSNGRNEYITSTWLNNGHGWHNETPYDSPTDAYIVNLTWFGTDGLRSGDRGVRLADVNGDGLADIVQNVYDAEAKAYRNRVWINSGLGWILDSTYSFPSGSYFGYFNKYNSHAYNGDRGVRLADVNGDGLTDVVQNFYNGEDSTNYSRTWISNTPLPDLLSEITTEIGGKYSFEYTPSTKFDNTGADSISDLPYLFWVVNETTIDNGMTGDQHTETTYTYDYANGLYDHEDREFRGFGYVKVTDPMGTTAEHYFHQDDGRKGREYDTQVKDSSGNPYTKTENTWSSSISSGVYTVTRDKTLQYTYDGVLSGPKITDTRYYYDSYGSVIKTSYLGDTTTSSDNREVTSDYYPNINAWIVDRVARSILKDSEGQNVSKSWYYYDDNTAWNTAPSSKGDLTKEENWLPINSNPVTKYGYESYGNQINVTDSNGHSTFYEYDATTHTFPERITNAKGQSTDYTYDLGTGNLLSTTDPNGFMTSYEYDGFGRIVWENRPYDTSGTRFSDSTGEDLGISTNIAFDQAESDVSVYLRIPKSSTVINASMDVSALPSWDIFNDEGDGTTEWDTVLIGDAVSYTEYVNATADFIPNEGIEITGVMVNICSASGPDYGVLVNITVDEILVKDAWDPDWSTGIQTLTFDNSILVSGDIPHSIKFISNNASGDGPIGRLNICLDSSAGPAQRYHITTSSGGYGNYPYYANISFIISLPTNLALDTANDSTIDWSMTGELDPTNPHQSVPLNITAIQEYLDNVCTTDLCNVPLKITSDSAGIVELSSLSVSPNLATKKYTYETNGIAPESVKVSQREQAGPTNTLDTYTFVDGLGRTIQARADAEDSTKQIVADMFYNEISKVKNQSVPYLAAKSTGYVSPDTTQPSTDLEYDPIGRNILVRNTDNTVKTTAFDHWKTTSTDENGHQKIYYLDAHGRIKQVDEKNQGSTYTTTYDYDVLDNLVKITDDYNNVFSFYYDSLGRKIGIDDPDMGVWNYSYDGVGNLINQKDAKGTSIVFEYDVLNRVTRKDHPTDEDITYAYDETIGTLSEVGSPDSTTHYYYDQRLREIKEVMQMDGITQTTEWSYDSADRITSQTNPSGETLNLGYNSQGEVDNIGNVITNINYDALNKVTRRDYGNSKTTMLTYDIDDFRLNSIFTSGLQDLSYDYDNVGNVISRVDAIDGMTETFGYDGLDRLTFAVETGGYSRSYGYDSIGNILSLNDSDDVTDFTYGNGAGPHAVTWWSRDTSPPITEDNAPSGWQNEHLTVNLTPIDLGGSGIADTFYCVDQTNACTPSTSGTSVLVDTEGINYVRYYSTDNAGNSEGVKSATVKIDPTLPTINITSPENTTYYKTSVDLNYSINVVSSVDWSGYSLDGQENVTTSGEVTTFSNSTGGDLGAAYNITFPSNGFNSSVYLKIPKNSTVIGVTMDVSGYMEEWQSDLAITSGLGDMGTNSYPEVFNMGGIWYLISGRYDGNFYGYKWTGAQWQQNLSIFTGLNRLPYHSYPAVFQKDGTWYLITGEYYGNFYGYNWTGARWQSDSGIIAGMEELFAYTAPEVFQKDGIWYMIAGEAWGKPYGYSWTGSRWQSDSGIIAGLGNIDRPEVFTKDGIWYLIDGKDDGNFHGYKWRWLQWQSDSEIVSGLGDIGAMSDPAVFNMNGTWYLISGEYGGTFDGYIRIDNYPTNLSIDTANDSTIDWILTGELNSANSPQTVDDLNITAINKYIDTCTADEEGNCLVPLNISSDSAGIVQLDALSAKYYSNTTLTSLSEGGHNVTVYANNTAGNMNSSTVYFAVDLPPTIIIDSPTNTIYTTNSIGLKVSASDDIDTWMYNLNSAGNTVFTPNTTITVGEGLSNIVIYANDTAGNMNSSTVYFTVDFPSTITITSPENITYNTRSVDLNYSLTNEYGLDWIAYFLDGQDNVTTSGEVITFSDSSREDRGSATNVSFEANGLNTSVFIKVPKNATVYSAEMNVSGFMGYNKDAEDASDFQAMSNPGNAYDENWNTYATQSGDGVNVPIIWENYTIPGESTEIQNISLSIKWYSYNSPPWNLFVFNWTGNSWVLIGQSSQGETLTHTYQLSPVSDYISRGRILSTKVNAIIIGTGGFDKYYESKLFVMTTYPSDISIDTGIDTIADWSIMGRLNSTNSPKSLDLNATAINSYVSSNPGESDGFVLVPLNISSDSSGTVQLDALSVKYYSDVTLQSLSGGGHNTTVYVNERSGNMNSLTVYFSVEAIPPVIIVDSPANISYTTTSIDLNVSTDENMDTWMYNLNSAGNTTFTPNTTITGEVGMNNIVVYANDTIGNMNSTTIWFTVDFIPQITLNAPINTTTDTVPDLNLTIDELTNIIYSWYDGANISGCRNCDSYNTTYGESVPDADTNLLMHFNENNGLTAYDDSSNKNGTIYGAAWSTGRFGPALDFYADTKNAGDYIKVPHGQSMDFTKSDSFTIAAWIRYKAVPVTYNSYIFDKYQSDTGYHMFLKSNDGRLRFMYHTDTSGDLGVYSTTLVNDSKWHYVVAVRDVTAGRGYVYVDGSLEGNESDSTTGSSGTGANAEDLTVGTFSQTYGFFNGTIDEVHIIKRALSATEITDYYNKTLSEGAHNVTVYANDTVGNMNSSTVYFTVDTIPPAITIDSPQNTTTGDSTPLLSATMIDTNPDKMWFSVDGGVNSPLYFGSSIETEFGSSYRPIGYEVASDVDNPENAYDNDYDDTSTYAYLGCNNNDVATYIWDTGLSGNKNPLLYYSWNIYAADDGYIEAYNHSSSSWIILRGLYYVTEPLAKRNLTLSSDFVNSTGGIEVKFSIVFGWEDCPYMELYDVYVASSAATNQLENGQHNVTVYASDIAGNLNSATVWFTVDTTPLTYSNLSPPNNSYTSDSGQDISIVIIDEDDDVNAGDISMTVAGNYYDTNSGKFNYDTNSGLLTYYADDGEFNEGQVVYVVVNAEDNVGNQMEVAWSFTVGLPPQITLDSPTNETITDTTPDLNLTTGELANITYSWNGEANISGCRNCDSYGTTYGESAPDANTSLLLHFNENFGDTAFADSGNNNATLVEGASWTTGRFGYGVKLDGLDDGVNVSYDPSLDIIDNNDPFAFGIWFKLDQNVSESGSNRIILAQDDGGGTGVAWLSVRWSGAAADKIQTALGGAVLLSNTLAVNDSWYFVVITYNGSELSMYVNGSFEVSRTDATIDQGATGTYLFGRSKILTKYFNGTIDEAMFFERNLSAAEIQELYNKTLSIGQHRVTAYANDIEGKQNSTTRYFTVE